MRTKKYIKKLIIIMILTIFASSYAYSLYNPNEYTIDFLNVEKDFSYELTTTNTENTFETESKTQQKVIELTTISTDTTSSEYYRAIPHINIENYQATITNGTDTLNCRLLIKTTVDYDNSSTDDVSWYEIDDVKTYIYNRTKLEDTADSFELTLYYLIEDPTNVLSDSSSDSFLTINTGGTTNYYLFYLNNNVEQSYYSSSLSDSLSLQATPESFDDSYSTYLQVSVEKPSSWTDTSFFDNLGSKNLEWIVYLKAVLTDTDIADSSDSYYIGLNVSSENDFNLVSDSIGDGDKTFPYSLRITKNNNNNNFHTVSSSSNFVIRNISAVDTKQFEIYSYSNSDTTELNAGIFSDTIYLEFVTDIDYNYSSKKIRVFD